MSAIDTVLNEMARATVPGKAIRALQPMVHTPSPILSGLAPTDEAIVPAEPSVPQPRRKSSARKGDTNAEAATQLMPPGAVQPKLSPHTLPVSDGAGGQIPREIQDGFAASEIPAKRRARKADEALKPLKRAPSEHLIHDGLLIGENHDPVAVVSGESEPLVAEIRQLWRRRVAWHSAEKRQVLQGKAICRAWTDGDKEAASKLFDTAAAGKPVDPDLMIVLAPFFAGIEPHRKHREMVERQIAKSAAKLPVAPWIEGVRGVGMGSLGAIVGEAGDVASYKSPAALWKRFGLAVFDGDRQRKHSDADMAALHGYNPTRRSIVWNIGECIVKAQVRAVKDDAGAKTPDRISLGEYGRIYLERKAYEAAREGVTPKHADNRAKRYMTKRFLRDLWVAAKAAGRGQGGIAPQHCAAAPGIPSTTGEEA